MSTLPSPRVGISSCLLGENVRYDGGHKHDLLIVATLGPIVEWVPVCPEVEIDLGTPREPIRLIRDRTRLGGVRLVTVKTGFDLTKRMRRYARHRVRELANENLSGYILKKNSPSCGLERVEVWSTPQTNERLGQGMFAAELTRQMPDMPVEDEGRLREPRALQEFINRVLTYQLRDRA